MQGDELATAFCLAVTDSPKMTNATARIGAWLVGAAMRTGGFPIELSISDITDGFTRQGHSIKGTGSRHETIKASIEWLEANGYLSATDGEYRGFGYKAKVYNMTISG